MSGKRETAQCPPSSLGACGVPSKHARRSPDARPPVQVGFLWRVVCLQNTQDGPQTQGHSYRSGFFCAAPDTPLVTPFPPPASRPTASHGRWRRRWRRSNSVGLCTPVTRAAAAGCRRRGGRGALSARVGAPSPGLASPPTAADAAAAAAAVAMPPTPPRPPLPLSKRRRAGNGCRRHRRAWRNAHVARRRCGRDGHGRVGDVPTPAGGYRAARRAARPSVS